MNLADRPPIAPKERGPTRPIVDRNRCEGKGQCVLVCPENVFEIRPMTPDDRSQLSWIGKLRSRAHGGRTAYTPNADACRACGQCVVACPETAITLEWIASPAADDP